MENNVVVNITSRGWLGNRVDVYDKKTGMNAFAYGKRPVKIADIKQSALDKLQTKNRELEKN